MIHVIANIEVVPGKREQLLEEFRRLGPLVRAEAGCLAYEPTVDHPTGLAAQLPVRDHVVTIVERWESQEALRAHAVAPHMQEYRVRVKDIVVRVQLQVLEPA
jgi:quinol monooxygenase YgiN